MGYFDLKKQIQSGTTTSKAGSYFELKKGLSSTIEANRARSEYDRQQKEREERIRQAQELSARQAQEAKDVISPWNIAKETGKTLWGGTKSFVKEVLRTPLTVPLKVIQTATEAATGKPQIYKPGTRVEKFFYGDEPRQSYLQDQESIRKFGKEKGLGNVGASLLGAGGAIAEAVFDVEAPGAVSMLAKKSPTLAKFLAKAGAKTSKIDEAIKVGKTTEDDIVKIFEEEGAKGLEESFALEPTKLKAGEFAPIAKEIQETTGKKLTATEQLKIKDDIERGVSKEAIINDIVEPPKAKPTEPVKPKESIIKKETPDFVVPEKKETFEIQQYMANPNNKITKEVAEKVKSKNYYDVKKLEKNEDDTFTVYRDGEIEIGKPNSFSITKTSENQKPFKIKESEILIDTTDKRFADEVSTAYKTDQAKAIYKEALQHWNKYEKEIIAIPEKLQELKYKPTIKTSGLSKSVKSKAVKDKLIYGFDKRFKDLPDYDVRNVKEKASKATDFVLNDYDNAVKVAMGEQRPPSGLLPEDVYVALDLHATNNKDIDMIRRLATESKLVGEATEMGQRIQTLSQLEPDSAISKIKEVSRERISRIEKKTGKKVTEEKNKIVKEIKEKVKQPIPTKDDWVKFISDITC